MPEELFSEYLLFSQKSGWYLLHASALTEDVSRIKVSRVGLKAFRKVGQFVKPTTRFIQTFGKFASRRVFQVSPETLSKLVAGEEIPVAQDYEKGYVILAINKTCILGLGFFIHGRIRSQLPGNQLKTTIITNFPGHS